MNVVGKRVIKAQSHPIPSSRAGEIEAWGHGIERVFEACRQASVPEPLIQVEPGDFRFEFPFSDAYLALIAGESTGVFRGATHETTPKTPPKTPPKTVDAIAAILRDHPGASRSEIAEMLGGITDEGVPNHLRKLRARGRIRHIGPSRGGRWEVVEDHNE